MTWKKVPIAERLRFCQFHQKDHAYPLHCKKCGCDLTEGYYYHCPLCRGKAKVAKQERAKQRKAETRAVFRARHPPRLTWAEREVAKLVAWKEWAKP